MEKEKLIKVIFTIVAITMFLIVVGGIVGSLFLLKKSVNKLIEDKQQLNIKYERCDSALVQSEKWNEFKKDIGLVGAIPYSETKNCYYHSKLLQGKLSERGIQSSIFITPERDHAWIGVWIEATTGNFIETNKYRIGEIRDKNLDVVCSNIN